MFHIVWGQKFVAKGKVSTMNKTLSCLDERIIKKDTSVKWYIVLLTFKIQIAIPNKHLSENKFGYEKRTRIV